MDTRHVRAALAVAEFGTFTAAAASLFMSQSTLSRQVGELERQLGVVLFFRGPARATPTASGHRFLREARKVLAAVEAAESAARSA